MEVGSQQPQPSSAATALDPVPKPRLCLSATDDDWEKDNIYFKQSIVLLVQSELSVDGKYTALAEGIYNYFAENHGTKKMQHRY